MSHLNEHGITHLRHVDLAVNDYETQRAFYRDTWGLTEVGTDSGLSYFAAEGSPEQYVIRLRQSADKRLDLIAFGALDELSIEDWDFTMRNELDLVYYTVRAAWPHLKSYGGGSIINVGSIAALRGVEFMPQNAHSTAKGGVLSLTLQLVVEGGPHGIRANAISPGLVETTNTAPLLADPPERMKKVVLDRIPLGRHGRCDDVVNAALYLASDESAWVSGANLVVDGGGSALG